jgi:hypothetical protein
MPAKATGSTGEQDVFAAEVKHSGNKSFGIGHERGAPGSLALLLGIERRREEPRRLNVAAHHAMGVLNVEGLFGSVRKAATVKKPRADFPPSLATGFGVTREYSIGARGVIGKYR